MPEAHQEEGREELPKLMVVLTQRRETGTFPSLNTRVAEASFSPAFHTATTCGPPSACWPTDTD